MFFSRIRIRRKIYESSQLARVIEGNAPGIHRLLWDLFPDQTRRTFLYREEIAREQLGPGLTVRGEPIYYLLSQSDPRTKENPLFSVETKNYDPRLEKGERLLFECRANPVVTRQGKKHDVVMDAQLRLLKSLVQEFAIASCLPENAEKSDFKKLLLETGGENLNRKLVEILDADARYAERVLQVSERSERLDQALKAFGDQALDDWFTRQGERLGFKLEKDAQGLTKLQSSAYRWHALPGKGVKGAKSGFSSIDFTGELRITETDQFRKALFGGIGRAKAFGCGLLLVKREA